MQAAYQQNASITELKTLLGRARAKKGMFEGDLINGELEIGQVSSGITEIKSTADIVKELVLEFNETQSKMAQIELSA